MWRVAWTSLWARKWRLVMSTAAIVFGTAFVVGTLMFTDTLDRSFTALFASDVGDVVVSPVGADAAPGTDAGEPTAVVPATVLDRLREVPGVARVDGNVIVDGVYLVDRTGKAVGGFGPPSDGRNYTGAPSADGEGLRLVSGRAPSGAGEVVLESRTAERAGYGVGDTVPILTPGRAGRISAEVVGIVAHPDGSGVGGATLVEFDTATAQRLLLGGRDAFTDVWVTAAPGVDRDRLAEQVSQALPEQYGTQTADQAAAANAGPLREALGFLTTFLLIFGGIALVVGSFLIVNTFSMLVAQRTRELALLRALGASRRQVVRSVRLEALVLGLAGSTAGLGLGVALTSGLVVLFARLGLDLSGSSLVLRPRTVLVAYAVGVLVTVGAAWLPARRSATVAPVQALRDDVALPEQTIRRRFLVGLVVGVLGVAVLLSGAFDVGHPAGDPSAYVGVGALLVLGGTIAAAPVLGRPVLGAASAVFRRGFGIVGTLAGQNVMRNPRRTAATASALMIGLTLAATMAIIGASAKASIDASVDSGFVGDYVVSSVYGGTFSPTIGERMGDVDGVASVGAVSSQSVRTPQGRVRVAGLDAGATGLFGGGLGAGGSGGSGGPGLPRDVVVITPRLAESQGLQRGSELVVQGPRGEVRWRVLAVAPANGILQASAITGTDTLRVAGFRPRDSLLVVDATPGAVGVYDRLQDIVRDEPIVTVQDENAYAASQREPVDRFVRIVYALLGLALLIAVLGIVNTLALSVVERTREVGLLRAVGLGRAQVRLMIVLESVAIAVLGALLGAGLGVGFGVALMRTLRDEGLDVVRVPWAQVVVFLLVAVVVGVLAAVLPARRAARLDVLRAVATE